MPTTIETSPRARGGVASHGARYSMQDRRRGRAARAVWLPSAIWATDPTGRPAAADARDEPCSGVIISDITKPVLHLDGPRHRGCRAGWPAIRSSWPTPTRCDERKAFLEVAAAEQMAGVVLSPSSSSKGRSTSLSNAASRSSRSTGGCAVHRSTAVTVNNFRAAFRGDEHLISRAASESALRRPGDDDDRRARWPATRPALRAAGLGDDPELVVYATSRIDGGRAATAELLSVRGRRVFVSKQPDDDRCARGLARPV